jgi:hypothetical protein
MTLLLSAGAAPEGQSARRRRIVAAALVVIAVNVSPGFYDRLPTGVQRSISRSS